LAVNDVEADVLKNIYKAQVGWHVCTRVALRASAQTIDLLRAPEETLGIAPVADDINVQSREKGKVNACERFDCRRVLTNQQGARVGVRLRHEVQATDGTANSQRQHHCSTALFTLAQ
jgi:hypothetical protein